VLAVAGLTVALGTAGAVGAQAAAPGCPASLPTFVGGVVQGYPDGRALNVLIGVAEHDARGRAVNPAGLPCGLPGSGCSFCGSGVRSLSALAFVSRGTNARTNLRF